MKKFKNSPSFYKDEYREKEKVRKENAGKFFYDLAKIAFTVVALTGLTSLFSDMSNTENWISLFTGFSFTVLLGLLVNQIFKEIDYERINNVFYNGNCNRTFPVLVVRPHTGRTPFFIR